LAKKKRTDYGKKLRLLRLAGLESFLLKRPGRIPPEYLGDLPGRVDRLLGYLERAVRLDPNAMFCLIMYDIADNKIRNYIAKYLLQEGCQRIQKSVYLARLPSKKIRDIRQTLQEVNDMYDNEDSIMILPLGDAEVEKLSLIGKSVDMQLVIDRPNTLFF